MRGFQYGTCRFLRESFTHLTTVRCSCRQRVLLVGAPLRMLVHTLLLPPALVLRPPSLPDDMRHQKQQFSPEKPPPPERVPTARELLQAARNVQRERDSILADATAKRNAAEAFRTQLARELASLGKTLRPRSRPTLFASNSA